MVVLLLILAWPARGELRAGVGQRVITPDLVLHKPVYLAGFGQNRQASGVHDDLYARCLALQAGTKPLVLCAVDSIGLFWDDVVKIRRKVSADVVVSASHDHQAPDTMGLWGPAQGQSGIHETYNQLVVDRTAEAANEALAKLEPARLRLASAKAPELDTFIDDDRPPLVHDAELIAFMAENKSGKPIAVLVNWANHPETLGSKNTRITADYVGFLRARLEKLAGGVAVFFNGAVGGMQSPLGTKLIHADTGARLEDGTFEKAEYIGQRVAGLAAAAIRGGRKVKVNSIVYREKLISIPVQNPGFQKASDAGVFKGRKQPGADGSGSSPVGLARLSHKGRPVLEIAMIPGEMYPELSLGGILRDPGADFPDAPFEPPIKGMMKAPYKMLFGLANDEIGYIIPKVEWDEKPPYLKGAQKRWYGEVNSVGPEAAGRIAAAFAELVK